MASPLRGPPAGSAAARGSSARQGGSSSTSMPLSAPPLPRAMQGLRSVYSVDRDLYDIPQVSCETSPPSLGERADIYLWHHGWKTSAIVYMHKVYSCSSSRDDFVVRLMEKGAIGIEMEYLWDLILGTI